MKIDKTNFLEAINEILEGNIEFASEGRTYPSFFVVGAPRSGTTILTQLLTTLTTVGYIDNLAASFWKAPEIGALLSRKLVADRVFVGNSTFGRTNSISEPHEFGAFWRDYLNYPDTDQIDSHSVSWEPLFKKLDNFSAICESPVLYKVFQLMWHAAEFHGFRPSTKWVWITRDAPQNVRSLLDYRQQLGVDDSKWASVKPLKSDLYSQAPAAIKCASQVIFINEWIENQLKLIPASNWFHVELETLVENPEETICAICRFLDLQPNLQKLNESKQQLESHCTVVDAKINEAIEYVRSNN